MAAGEKAVTEIQFYQEIVKKDELNHLLLW